MEDTPDSGPLLGALFRLALQSFLSEIMGGLVDAGYPQLQPAHFSVLQPLWAFPDGLRLNDLAKRARITKQSMGELVEQLFRLGYVDKAPDPKDGRARLVRLTTEGRTVTRLIRRFVRNVENDWANKVGRTRVEDLRCTLRLLFGDESNE